jgi:hypothetical protein
MLYRQNEVITTGLSLIASAGELAMAMPCSRADASCGGFQNGYGNPPSRPARTRQTHLADPIQPMFLEAIVMAVLFRRRLKIAL